MRLRFSDDDLNKISKLAKERKFSQDKKIIYSQNNQELIENFVNSYEFLNNLSDNLFSENQKVSRKISKYLKNYEVLFMESHSLLSGLNSDTHIGKSDIKNDINKLMDDNKKNILNFINSVFPIGRIVSIYDPDEYVGQT